MKLVRSLQTAGRWASSRVRKRSAILLYHRIVELEDDPFDMAVSPKNFESHLATICERYRPVSLLNLVRDQLQGEVHPSSVALTFDDGYADVVRYGLPLLEKYQVPATIYMISDCLGESPWWDELILHILKCPVLPQNLKFDLGSQEVSFSIKGLTRKEILKRIYPVFQTLSPGGHSDALDQLRGQVECSIDLNDHRLMEKREMIALAQHPLITLGAHTMNHVQLATLQNKAQHREVGRSIDKIGEAVNQQIETFSYPFGISGRDFNQCSIEAVRKKGLSHSLAADMNVVTAKSDPFRLPRLWVSNLDGPRFAQLLNRWL